MIKTVPFKINILPKIVESYRLIKNTRRPQAIKIVATGYYRIAKNSKEIIALIEANLKEIDSKNLNLKVQLLSPKQESRYSYISFVETYNLKESLQKRNDFRDEIHKKRGLHIDIGTGTTEVSVFQNMDFKNTISINVGTAMIIERYKYFFEKDIQKYDFEFRKEMALNYFYKIQRSIETYILQHLNENFTSNQILDFCVTTGSSINADDQEYITDSKLAINQVAIIVEETKNFLIPKGLVDKAFEHYIWRFSGFFILKVILDFFSIKELYFNKATLRMGAYYSFLKELQE
ncbi:MAG: Ppx/GppA phosphatase family protein [Polaribacter sp.]